MMHPAWTTLPAKYARLGSNVKTALFMRHIPSFVPVSIVLRRPWVLPSRMRFWIAVLLTMISHASVSPPSVDGSNRWQTSLTYTVRMVNIESDISTDEGALVRTRDFGFGQPVAEGAA